MQLLRAVPLSFLALLTTAGCVSVAPGTPAPVRGPVPPVGAADLSAPPPAPPALPLGRLPARAADGPLPATAAPAVRGAAEAGRPPADRPAKPTAPRRTRPHGAPTPHARRKPVPPPGVDELCAAAEGAVPPSIVDLCLREYGR
ncbi:hypothetical protein [Streptomyces sp. NPDC058674]|uniref:hypothetical protein n=1 Tax=Streptomyces sp. NPDC058674 TaxID=3346592 RepID=UPI0036482BBC